MVFRIRCPGTMEKAWMESTKREDVATTTRERNSTTKESKVTKDEALKLALEALDNLAAWSDGEVGGHMDEPYSAEVARRTITAIKEALANEALEKMAENARELGLDYEPAQTEQHQDWCASLTQMLMSMPPKPAPCNCKPKPEQPKVRTGNCLRIGVCASEGHKIAPQRKPLTDEEIENTLLGYRLVDAIDIARAIESAHGIKG